MKKQIWVFIKDKKEVERRAFADHKEADDHERLKRYYFGKWCDSWCTLENAIKIGYNLVV